MNKGENMRIKIIKIKHNIIKHLNNLSKMSINILLYGLLFCTIYLLTTSIFYFFDLKIDPVGAVHIYKEIFEYIYMSILLIVGGALLFDIVEKSDKKNDT